MKPEIFFVVHNIDGQSLRSESTQTCLSILAQSPFIHIIASIDHINAPLMWDQKKLSSFKWLWHDTTTYEPCSEEGSYENCLVVQQTGSLGMSSLIATRDAELDTKCTGLCSKSWQGTNWKVIKQIEG